MNRDPDPGWFSESWTSMERPTLKVCKLKKNAFKIILNIHSI